ncbi:ABC transporter permease [Nitrospirillum iridis]|uniref:Putative ABC transport system permease protein n=1 Tax=Nitrospirillum iridis TaxID=765888 RepID=A0A7X0B2Z9_9PROT|nr:ABC transporter permease [Nitrospirillum iridis]MBB6254794.1 putative ABC transport system permease protein [Nitrospirillum iridis]
MLLNYLRVALRVLVRQRLYTVLNGVGLALGIATAAMMGLFVWHETHFDGFHGQAGRIFRVLQARYQPAHAPSRMVVTSKPLGPTLAQDLPEVETMVRVARHFIVLRHQGTPVEDRIALVDAPFFRLFDFPFLAGDPATALKDPGTVVMTESQARRYFGTSDAVGRTLMLTSGTGLTVTGVVRDLPSNTLFSRELPLTLWTNIATKFHDGWDPMFADQDEKWRNDFIHTFVLLKPGVDPATLAPRFPALLAAHRQPMRAATPDVVETLELQPLTAMHIDPIEGIGTSPATLAAFVGVAALVLGIAMVNFINLSTARSSLRAREVAIRKTLGSRRGQLVGQFLLESALLALASGLLGLVLVELAMPRFLGLLNVRVDGGFLSGGWLLVAVLPPVLAVGLLGGLYPALVLSRPRPTSLLRGPQAAGGGRLRAALVMLQFTAAIVLVIATIVMGQQTRYASTQDLGFRPEGAVVLRGLDRPAGLAGVQALRDALSRIPGVVSVGAAANVPSDRSVWTNNYRLPGEADSEPDLLFRTEPVDVGYLDALGVPRLAGRLFDPDHPADITSRAGLRAGDGNRVAVPIVLSAAAVKRLGLGTADQAVGRTVLYGGDEPLTVIGVVDDVQFDSARSSFEPTIYMAMRDELSIMLVRLAPNADAATLAAIDDTWRRLLPDLPLKREFLDDHIRQVYEEEARQSDLLALFSGLAILIACLGLFGLAAFTAERRTKEIGLRKVLGATVADIVRLLVWQFSKPVLMANLVAWPLAWVVMGRWLGGFAYRVQLDPLIFALAGLSALLIAWATVAGHAARVAAAKPVTALRYE